MKNLPATRKPLQKHTLALLLALVTAIALMVPAMACGHHGGKGGQTQVTVCTVKDCTQPGRHVHNGVIYCGYAHTAGVCDGKCLALCPVESCTLTGRHVHNGTTYCGSCHEAGFCDGSCSAGNTGGHHHGGRHH